MRKVPEAEDEGPGASRGPEPVPGDVRVPGWATAGERTVARRLYREFRPVLDWTPPIERPFMAVLIEDVCVHVLLTRRIEERLTASAGVAQMPAVETVVQLRKALRDSVGDTVAAMVKIGMPKRTGLADMMAPILKAGAGVYEEALQWQREHPGMDYDEETDGPVPWRGDAPGDALGGPIQGAREDE